MKILVINIWDRGIRAGRPGAGDGRPDQAGNPTEGQPGDRPYPDIWNPEAASFPAVEGTVLRTGQADAK